MNVQSDRATQDHHGVKVHEGMPSLPVDARFPWFKRWLSDKVYYLTPALMLLSLSVRHGSLTLPTIANPEMEVGGVWGERKSQGISLFGPSAARHVAPLVTILRGPDAQADLASVVTALDAACIGFPVVIKPDRGYQGWGVREVAGPEGLLSYLQEVAAGVELVIQAKISYPGEAGVFYIRPPGERRGRIVSMALTYAPHVVGDGSRTVGELVLADRVLRANAAVFRNALGGRWRNVPGRNEATILTNTRSARLGAVYLDVTDDVTPALQEIIDEIARDVAGFHFGRFDLRFRSLDALLRGKDFQIVELNGAGAEMLHIWEGRGGLLRAYAALWRQYRTVYAIGAEMRRRGHRPAGLRTMIPMQKRQERLRRKCPQSG